MVVSKCTIIIANTQKLILAFSNFFICIISQIIHQMVILAAYIKIHYICYTGKAKQNPHFAQDHHQHSSIFIKINISSVAVRTQAKTHFSFCLSIFVCVFVYIFFGFSLFQSARHRAAGRTIVIKDPREHSHDQRQASVKIKESYQHLVAVSVKLSTSTCRAEKNEFIKNGHFSRPLCVLWSAIKTRP